MQSLKTRLRGTVLHTPLKMLVAPPRRLRRWWQVERWRRRMRRFYAQFIKPGELVFDVGANFGSRTRVFLELGARVVAVEPQKECARYLLASFGSDSNFHLVNKALGAASGTSDLFILKHPRTASLSLEHMRAVHFEKHQAGTLEKSGRVSVTTLDALIHQYGSPAFVKIDAEGFEYEIMRGLSQPLTALSFEFVPTYLEPALKSIDYLLRFGTMRLNYVVGERFEWMLDEWVTADELIPTLKSYAPETHFIYGDVYVRFEDEQRSHNTHSFRRTPWTNNKQTH